MPAFSYEAVDDQGKDSRGVIEADSARAARALLRGRALVPMNVQPIKAQTTPASDNWLHRDLWTRRALSAASLAIFTRQLSGLVSAGLPIERALTVLAEEAEDKRQQAVIAGLRAEVNSGASDCPKTAVTATFNPPISETIWGTITPRSRSPPRTRLQATNGGRSS